MFEVRIPAAACRSPGARLGGRGRGAPPRPAGEREGFTLTELLVVAGVIGVLASLLLPVLGRAKSKAQGAVCLSNIKQLTLAWSLYAGDNGERLVHNLVGDLRLPTAQRDLDDNWVNNVLTWELDPDNTNTAFIRRSPLGPYLGGNRGVFLCPADYVLSTAQRDAGWSRRVRSYALNAMVGDPGPSRRGVWNVNNPGYRQFLKLTDFPQPAGIFGFLDEHPDSVTDGYFLNKGEDPEWLHLPASYHLGAAGLGFADGHAETHRWLFASTKPPARPEAAALPLAVLPGERADFDWVEARTSIEQ